MNMNFTILFSFMITIFGLPGIFSAGSSEEDNETKEPFNVDGAKDLLYSMLTYIKDLGALGSDPSYDSIRDGISAATDADSVIAAGRKILDSGDTQVNLVAKANKNAEVATDMIGKIDAYKLAFWELLDNAGLMGDQVPLSTRLNVIRKRAEESLYKPDPLPTYESGDDDDEDEEDEEEEEEEEDDSRTGTGHHR